MDRKQIGKKIYKLRLERGFAQNKLAKEAGVSPSYIRDLERCEKCPTVEVLDNICFALGVTLVDFLSEEKDGFSEDRVASLNEQQKKLLNDFLKSL